MPAAASTPGRCPVCQGSLPPGAPPGRCPACLLRLALQTADDDRPEDEEADTGHAAPAVGVAGPLVVPGTFAGYELIEPIGRGAMGVVYKARQTSLERFVALKVLDLAGRLPPDAARRFRAEAAAAAGLRHPSIVAIHEVGVYQGHHYLAMDLVEGSTLAALVAQEPLAADRAAQLLATVADAVHCAHAQGILHRDLKPSNILLDAAGRPHVADFGLAKRLDADADLTIPGQIMGSPNYMSPEQVRGARLAPASDVHALGAVLYHCLAGRPPFLGQTIPDTLHQVAHAEPVPLRLLVAGLPRDLETIVVKCLEKDPARRYPDARALADDLHRFLEREPIRARPVGPLERCWRWSLRHPAIAGLGTATTLLILAVAIGSPIAALRIRAERERAEDNLYAADMNVAQQALDRSSRGQARALLERHRPAPGTADRRGFEWRYLWSRSGRDDSTVLHAAAGERHLVAVPDSNLVAVGNTVWDPGPPPRRVFTLPAGSVALAIDPATHELLVRGPEGFVSWSMTAWAPGPLLLDEPVHAIAFSADGRWMATGGQQLRLWRRDAGSWRPVSSRPRVFSIWHNAHTLAFAPDGRTLVTGTGESWANRCRLEAWSLPALDPRPGLPPGPGDVLSLAFSPDGRRLLAGCWNGRIRSWATTSWTELETNMRHQGSVNRLIFSPDDPDILATTASDRTVRLWSLRGDAQLAALQGPLGQVWAMTFADRGRRLLTLEQHGRLAAWDASRRHQDTALIEGGPSTLPLGFSADGSLLATIDQTGTLRFWDAPRHRELATMSRQIDFSGVLTRDFEIIAPAITRDLETLAVGMIDGRLQLHHLPARTQHVWKAHARALRNVAFAPDDRTLATVADDGLLKFWDTGSRTLRAERGLSEPLAGEDFNVPLVWSPDGRLVALASASAITLHDPATGAVLRTLRPPGLVYSLRFSPDSGLLVSAEEDSHLSFWDPRRGVLLDRVATSHQEGVYDLQFAPDQRTLVTVVDHVKLWSVSTRQEVATLRGHERNIFATLLSPDGNLLVTADYAGAVRTWSALPFETIDAGEREQ